MPKLFKTDVASDADVKVFVCDIRSDADLVVFDTSSAWEASQSGIWFYTDIRGEADKTVFFTSSQWEADLIVFKTDIQSEAGWQNSAKSHLL